MFLQRITLAAILGGPIVVSFILPPPDNWGGSTHYYKVPCCLFRATTGIPCPLCGLTRSFVSLSHGDVKKAFRYHALGPVVYGAFLAGVIVAFLRKPRLDPSSGPPRSPWTLWLFVAVVLAFVSAWAVKLTLTPRAYW